MLPTDQTKREATQSSRKTLTQIMEETIIMTKISYTVSPKLEI